MNVPGTGNVLSMFWVEAPVPKFRRCALVPKTFGSSFLGTQRGDSLGPLLLVGFSQCFQNVFSLKIGKCVLHNLSRSLKISFHDFCASLFEADKKLPTIINEESENFNTTSRNINSLNVPVTLSINFETYWHGYATTSLYRPRFVTTRLNMFPP